MSPIEEQLNAVGAATPGGTWMIRGKAGTGKSTYLERVYQAYCLREDVPEIFLMTPETTARGGDFQEPEGTSHEKVIRNETDCSMGCLWRAIHEFPAGSAILVDGFQHLKESCLPYPEEVQDLSKRAAVRGLHLVVTVQDSRLAPMNGGPGAEVFRVR